MAAPSFQFSKFLQLIRAIFPRWSFFDRVGHGYELLFKVPGAADWQKVSLSMSRQPLGIFVNPRGNLMMAEANLLEHFVSDLADLQDDNGRIDSTLISQTTSFRLLCSWLGLELELFEVSKNSIQFKIVAVSAATVSDLFISDWLNLGRA